MLELPKGGGGETVKEYFGPSWHQEWLWRKTVIPDASIRTLDAMTGESAGGVRIESEGESSLSEFTTTMHSSGAFREDVHVVAFKVGPPPVYALPKIVNKTHIKWLQWPRMASYLLHWNGSIQHTITVIITKRGHSELVI